MRTVMCLLSAALLDNDFSQVKRVVETASDVPLNALRQAGNLGPLSAQ